MRMKEKVLVFSVSAAGGAKEIENGINTQLSKGWFVDRSEHVEDNYIVFLYKKK